MKKRVDDWQKLPQVLLVIANYRPEASSHVERDAWIFLLLGTKKEQPIAYSY